MLGRCLCAQLNLNCGTFFGLTRVAFKLHSHPATDGLQNLGAALQLYDDSIQIPEGRRYMYSYGLQSSQLSYE
eukprot:scaffold15107_cov38-Prasinocladus_malaysianus.AAC.1